MNKDTVYVISSILAALFLSGSLVGLAVAVENSWIAESLMPTARYSLGVAAVNGKIYALGGHKANVGAIGTNEQYDPTTDTWTPKTSMPTPREAFAIAVWQNKIYVFGGLGPSGMITTTDVYDPESDFWASKASLPTSRIFLSASIVNDKIYVIGGESSPSNQTIGKNEVYDPLENSWMTKTPLPTSVCGHVSAVIEDKIYVLGGHADSGTTNLNQVYDPVADTWTNKTTMPNGVEFAAGGATSGVNASRMIYVFGGSSSSESALDYTQAYNPQNDSWTAGSSMPTGRNNLAVGIVEERLFAIGGLSIYALKTTEEYTPLGYVPEYPSLLFVPLFVTLATLAFVICRKRLRRPASACTNAAVPTT
jgi:N-acetylneuraminic acid mutarotase